MSRTSRASLLVLILVACNHSVITEEAEGSPKMCECGVFENSTPPAANSEPLVSKSPDFPIECNEKGKDMCSKMCVALAEASKDKAPKILCRIVKETDQPLQPIVYSRICGEKEWINAGLQTTLQICCKNAEPCA